MKREDVDRFEKLVGQLSGIYDEMSVLSKKSPSDATNMFKLRFINTLLAQSNDLLSEHYKPFKDFTEFNIDDVPQNSDVVLILSQYLQCFEKLRADNVTVKLGQWYWAVKADKHEQGAEKGFVYLKTVMPKRLRE